MTTNHLKKGVEAIPETSCMSNIPQTVGNDQRNVGVMNHPQSFRESLNFITFLIDYASTVLSDIQTVGWLLFDAFDF
jgi:hypothetical protein